MRDAPSHHSPLTTNDMSWMMPLRIGIVIDYPSPHMVALLDSLAKREDCSGSVLYCRDSAPGKKWGAPTGALPHKIMKGITLHRTGLQITPALPQYLRREPVDVWVINACYDSPNTVLAAWWLARNRIPWVYMNEPPRPRNRVLWAMKSWPLGFVLRRAWGIVGTGEKATARYQDLIGKGVPRTSVPYYIDLKDFQRLPLPPPPGNRGTLKFLACCQLIHRKGLDVLLDACSQLNGSDWKLTIVGDGPLRKKLEREGNLRFAPGQVRFVGEIPYGQRGEAFSGHHVFVFSSRWDGWGMVLPEALAAGLPVVATDQVMAAHEFIRPGVNGFVVPANDAGSLAEKMRHWMDHPETLSSMATAARQSVENYRPEVGAERLVLFLQSLLSKPHRAG